MSKTVENTAEQPSWLNDCEPEWSAYWRSAQPHRESVTQSLLASAAAGASLCIWGAGSCHDIELSQLLAHYGAVTLVDLNAKIVKRGIEFQHCLQHPRLTVAAPVELAGLPSDVLKANPSETYSAIAQSLLDSMRDHRIDLARYDVVASTGLISQIVLAVSTRLDSAVNPTANYQQISNSLITARRHHLRHIIEHLNPKGTGLLITDFMESDTVPALEETHEAANHGIADNHEADNVLTTNVLTTNVLTTNVLTTNVLTTIVEQELAKPSGSDYGLAPQQIHRDLLMYPPLANRIHSVSTSGYWTWQMPTRTYACYVVRFQKT